MNYLFLLNSSILFSLGAYLYASKHDDHSLRFIVLSFGLAAWNICVYLIEEIPEYVSVDFVVRVQLIASMVMVNGIYYFCTLYPYADRKYKYVVNTISFLILSGALIFTDYVSQAAFINEQIVYTDNSGFIAYALYMTVIAVFTALNLTSNFRQYREYRDRIKYLYIGLGLFGAFVMIFNVMLPLLGEYAFLNIGRLSSIFPALFFAYAITKYDFMDIGVIINRKTAWLLTIAIIVSSFSVVYRLGPDNETFMLVLLALLGIFWTFYGIAIQNSLLTSARRKFIRSWYNTEDLISEISSQITNEKNRESIFSIIEKVVDEAFQLEQSETIFAVRDEEQQLLHYTCFERSSEGERKSTLSDEIIVDTDVLPPVPVFYVDCDSKVQQYLDSRGYKSGKGSVVIPFYSPEFLEGAIVLGERSNQEPYSNRDMKFFIRLVNYMSAILYRLTPFEKLESQYFDNRQKLHEAEIQLIRAQKIESIVHATRQCHHEIRTPLNIIRLGIGRVKTIEDLDSYTVMAKEEITRALEIVEETLTITDVSKAPEDRTDAVDVNQVIQRCSRLVDRSRFNLTMNQGKVSQIAAIFSDLQVVVTNILHNAMEVMPDGGELIMSTYELSDSVVIEIEDNGPGIAEALRSKVWEPYFSGQDSDVGNSNAGRGWGLTIVNRIITEHRGTVKFTSEIGQGTKFVVSLPKGN